jgi:hypothetical protein
MINKRRRRTIRNGTSRKYVRAATQRSISRTKGRNRATMKRKTIKRSMRKRRSHRRKRMKLSGGSDDDGSGDAASPPILTVDELIDDDLDARLNDIDRLFAAADEHDAERGGDEELEARLAIDRQFAPADDPLLVPASPAAQADLALTALISSMSALADIIGDYTSVNASRSDAHLRGPGGGASDFGLTEELRPVGVDISVWLHVNRLRKIKAVSALHLLFEKIAAGEGRLQAEVGDEPVMPEGLIKMEQMKWKRLNKTKVQKEKEVGERIKRELCKIIGISVEQAEREWAENNNLRELFEAVWIKWGGPMQSRRPRLQPIKESSIGGI